MGLRSVVRRKEVMLDGLSPRPLQSMVIGEVVDGTAAETPHTVGVREGEADSGEVVDEVEDTEIRYNVVALVEPLVRFSYTT